MSEDMEGRAGSNAHQAMNVEWLVPSPRARDAAIPYLQDSEWHPDEIRCGEADTHWLIQAFARFERDIVNARGKDFGHDH